MAAAAGVSRADAQWRVEAWFGDAKTLPSQLVISQNGRPDISTHATWRTEPFTPTWVYAGRIAKWTGNSSWAFEYMHHKIYLNDPPKGIEYFRVTNGVNFLLAERQWRRKGWEYGVGAGPVYSVPISSVRGEVYNNGHGIFHSQYELSGPGVQVNLARRLRLLPFTFGTLAVKATATHLWVHVADGHAVTSSVAFHIQYGVSLQSRAR